VINTRESPNAEILTVNFHAGCVVIELNFIRIGFNSSKIDWLQLSCNRRKTVFSNGIYGMPIMASHVIE